MSKTLDKDLHEEKAFARASRALAHMGDVLYGPDFAPELFAPQSGQECMDLACALHGEITEKLKILTPHVSMLSDCREGCSACCSQLVPLTIYEAVVLMPDVKQLSLIKRKSLTTTAATMWPLLVAADFFNVSVDYKSSLYPDDVHAVWRDQQGACPFLQKDRCSVYPFRPLRCQTYYVRKGFRHACGDRKVPSPSLNDEYGQVIQALADRCFQSRIFGFKKPMKPFPMPIAFSMAVSLLKFGPGQALLDLGICPAE